MNEYLTRYWNKILTDADRHFYEPLIYNMRRELPEMMSRKIPTADVQQAFTIDALINLTDTLDNILCVGCYEDTGFEFMLRSKTRPQLIGIDPAINYDLRSYVRSHMNTRFNAIFSTSVIEHVRDDIQFLQDIIYLLEPGGIAILTCDFKNDWVTGQKVPYTSYRFYTKSRLVDDFGALLVTNMCEYIDLPIWDNQPFHFEWEGIRYDFATMVFRKR